VVLVKIGWILEENVVDFGGFWGFLSGFCRKLHPFCSF
jgi:hypothetical protein